MPVRSLEVLKFKIETKPDYIRSVINDLKAHKKDIPEEFAKWWDDLNIDPSLKKEISEKMDTSQSTSLDISAEAEAILNEGRAFHYVHGIWQKMHSKDRIQGMLLLVSFGTQSCTNTQGLHVSVNGPSGMGKSDGIKKMVKLLPDEYVHKGSISTLFLYGADGLLKDGSVISIDDIVWNGELGASVKKITTMFQEGDERGTKVDMQSTKQRTPKRIVFLVSSVDNQADEQVRDRFAMIEVEGGKERSQEIISFMKNEDKGDENITATDDEINICKKILLDLKNKIFYVVIPFSDRIILEGDPRAYRMFSDMLKSVAIFNYRKRRDDQEGGLVATEEDFRLAKEIYDGIGGHDPDKYTDSEHKVLQAIIDCSYNASRAEIRKKTGLSLGRIADILHGRKTKTGESQGLLYKCSKLSEQEYTGDSRKKVCYLDADFSFEDRPTVKLQPEHPEPEYEPGVMPDFLKTYDGVNTHFDPESAKC